MLIFLLKIERRSTGPDSAQNDGKIISKMNFRSKKNRRFGNQLEIFQNFGSNSSQIQPLKIPFGFIFDKIISRMNWRVKQILRRQSLEKFSLLSHPPPLPLRHPFGKFHNSSPKFSFYSYKKKPHVSSSSKKDTPAFFVLTA